MNDSGVLQCEWLSSRLQANASRADIYLLKRPDIVGEASKHLTNEWLSTLCFYIVYTHSSDSGVFS